MLRALVVALVFSNSLLDSSTAATAPELTSDKNADRLHASVFSPEIISTAAYERGATFTPDGKTFYFTKRAPNGYFSAICVSHYKNGQWTTPEVASFSGQFVDQDPIISPDGSKLFFTSKRPVNGQQRDDSDVWFVRKKENGWSQPENPGQPINTDANEGYASLTTGGTLYFHSSREGGKGGFDIYRAQFVDGKYEQPEDLGDEINSPAVEVHPFIAPDESYLIFVSAGRADEIIGDGNRYVRGDLYISRRRNGAWTAARHLGPEINTAAADMCPSVSPDGRYFFFTSERGFVTTLPKARLAFHQVEKGLRNVANGLGNIYRIEASALDAEVLPLSRK
jgi:Tol biopolymer transport system component